ncbi:MAG: succinate dehydrogenase [Calditrichaeota bacterium]|nr:MAG: succinate dehydrogenase [Calditrichota bacterium]
MTLWRAFSSSVGKKFVMAITGLAMIIFLIEHLSGNLLLFSKDPDPYNKYSHFLISFGWLLIVAELILLAFFIFHIISGISVFLSKRKARSEGYVKVASAGKPSKKNLSSVTMIYTGILMFIFIVIHLKTFKYGPHYTTTIDGVQMRDLHKLVWEVFQNPVYVIWYVAAMIFLGFHLRHGFWSAFQSLGIYHPRYTPVIYTIGVLVAIILAVGFLGIPIWIYFKG